MMTNFESGLREPIASSEGFDEFAQLIARVGTLAKVWWRELVPCEVYAPMNASYLIEIFT